MQICKTLLALAFIPALSFASSNIEVGFSPEGGAQELVLKTINEATKSIRMMAFSFSAPDVMNALVAAQKRGVDVQIVIDEKGNVSNKSLLAMRYVTQNGIKLRTDNHYRIQHDKVVITDGNTVETGSFNFAKTAEYKNSENVIVIHNAPDLVAQYLAHWENRWQQGVDFSS